MSKPQDLDDAARIPETLLDALAAVRSARAAALAEAGELAAERNAVAAEARRGDAAAQERIGRLNRRVVELAARLDHCDADENALGERFAETLELQQRATPGRPDAVAIGKALAAQDERADRLMQALEATFFARAALVRRLVFTGKGNGRALNSPARRQAAATHWGLDRHLAMQPAPQNLRAPLAEITAPLLRDLLHPHPRRVAPVAAPAPLQTEEIPA
jgi:seryl-tRNA synthetase